MRNFKKAIAVKNNRNRTFTVRFYDENGQLLLKKRTYPMSKQEFKEEENNTLKDWLDYFKHDNGYTVR